MAWPTLAQYNAAIARAPASLLDPSLSGGKPRLGPFGAPLPVSGGYAYIYELALSGGRRQALRCFREEDRERLTRAKASAGLVGRLRAERPELAPHFLETRWLEEGLETQAGRIPLVAMTWAEEPTLGAALEARHADRAFVERLRAEFAVLACRLESARLVHGDLQVGNILVEASGTPILIDYDDLRQAPAPGSPGGPELHPHFQHPEWGADSPAALKDRFPALVIDLGLAALAQAPGLFARYATGENVLFRAEDLAEPASSPLFAELASLPGLEGAALLMKGLCLGRIADLPGLADFRSVAYANRPTAPGYAPSSAPASASSAKAPTATTATPTDAPAGGHARAYQGPYPVYSALDLDGLEEAIGRKVEVVGRVHDVHQDLTKYGKPYTFINFDDWRSDCFKITLWSEALELYSAPPDYSWVGDYVSITGLVDEPYLTRYDTSQLSITLRDPSQLRLIDQAEADYRLGKGPAPKDAGKKSPGKPAKTPFGVTPTAATSSTVASHNEKLLAELGVGPAKALSPARPPSAGSGSSTGSSLGAAPSSSPSPNAPSSPPEKPNTAGCLAMVVAAILVFLILFWQG